MICVKYFKTWTKTKEDFPLLCYNLKCICLKCTYYKVFEVTVPRTQELLKNSLFAPVFTDHIGQAKI